VRVSLAEVEPFKTING